MRSLPTRLRKPTRYSSKVCNSSRQSSKGIANLFGSDIRVPVAKTLVLLADIGLDIFQLLVDALRFETFAGGLVGFGIPGGRTNGEFATELRHRAVDGYGP